MRALIISLTVSSIASGVAFAQALPVDRQSMSLGAPIQMAQAAMIEGEVRKVDTSAGKITLRHGPIPKYDMQTAMTMVFPLKDPAQMTGLNVGDKVQFDVVKEGGSLTITEIKKAP